MGNTKNDRDKHVEAFETHFAAIGGDGWEELTAKESCQLLSIHSLGLNGGSLEQVDEASDKIGFDKHNLVHCDDGSLQVLTLVEFTSERMTAH